MNRKTESAVLEIGSRPHQTAVTKSELRKFGLTLGIIFSLGFGLLFPWLWGKSLPLWPWIAAGLAAAFAAFFPLGLKPIHKILLAVGQVLGWINTRILLGAIFYLLLTPLSFLLKLFGKKVLDPRPDVGLDSYRVPRDKEQPIVMEEPF